MITVIILAAGRSTRMTSPKALLRIHGFTFVEKIAQTAKEAGVDSVTVVAGFHYQDIKDSLPHLKVLLNSEFERGQLTSLKAGLQSLGTEVTHALAWPVDHPLVSPETIRTMIQAASIEKKSITIPAYQGRRGHPVLYNRAAIEEALALDDSQTAKKLLEIFKDSISYVEVQDQGILKDIDLPDDYRRIIENVDP